VITGKQRELLSKPGNVMPNLEALKERFVQIPIMETLDFTLDGVDEGVAIMRLRYGPKLDGVFRSLHGGLMMSRILLPARL
jgi:acyl-coenzyme A thioesterase PaaI-like protein